MANRRVLIVAGAVVLIALFALQLFTSVRQQSISWDEDNHIYAGYTMWKNADYGLNPEHPPLLKLVAALPILNMQLQTPPMQDRYFKLQAFLGGKDFIFKNDAEAILTRARTAAAIFALCLLALVFVGTKEMFGTGAAFIALTLLAFDPNLLGHGAMVATDTAVSCLLFATIYAFYRYVKQPSVGRLVLTGVLAGLALSTKHNAILLLPMAVILAILEVVRGRGESANDQEPRHTAVRLGLAITAVGAIAVAVLWAFYGFRYAARPEGLNLNPALADFIPALRRWHEAALIAFLSKWRLLPESYLYGMTDVRIMSDFYQTYLLGKPYAHGIWFYFPFVFLIKTTVALLGFLLLAIAAFAVRALRLSREVIFVLVPPAVYLVAAMASGMNIGLRHILPMYVFVYIFVAAAAWALIRHRRQWAYVVAALVLFQVITSVRAYPDYIPYANEFWGGPSQTHKLLSDSNSDWGQQLKSTSKYLNENGIKKCWFVYFAAGVVDPSSYGIPCKPLPTTNTFWVNQEMDVPPSIDGPVLISAGNLSGFEFGPGPNLNPYEQFIGMKPKAVIQNAIFVFDGHFEIPLASALVHVQKARNLLGEKKNEEALAEAQQAASLAPEAVSPHDVLGDTLVALNRKEEARVHYERALELAKTVAPDFQAGWVGGLTEKLSDSREAAGQ
ncbi:MAG TPA: glycosyltransferase family 39 protein [Terriglobales bacterium]|nr:glycosyltransferase family 39 protein [Terriglobales bacterium]